MLMSLLFAFQWKADLFADVLLDDHYEFLCEALLKIWKVDDPVQHAIPLIVMRMEKRQLLYIGQYVFFICEIVTESAHKLIEEILGWRVDFLFEDMHQQE